MCIHGRSGCMVLWKFRQWISWNTVDKRETAPRISRLSSRLFLSMPRCEVFSFIFNLGLFLPPGEIPDTATRSEEPQKLQILRIMKWIISVRKRLELGMGMGCRSKSRSTHDQGRAYHYKQGQFAPHVPLLTREDRCRDGLRDIFVEVLGLEERYLQWISNTVYRKPEHMIPLLR